MSSIWTALAVSAVGEPLQWTPSAEGGQVSAKGRPVLEVVRSSDSAALPFPVRWEGDALVFEATLPSTGQGEGAVGEIRLPEAPPRVWLPHVSPLEDTVIGDHSLRSPAMIFADDRRVLALVPDVDDLRAAQRQGWRVWLDYDHPKKTVRVAAGAYKVGPFHIAYQPVPLDYRGQKPRVRMHVLVSDRKEDVRNPYALASRWNWEHFGRPEYAAGGVQKAPFGRYEGYVVNWAFAPEPKGWGDTVWQEFTIDGKPCGAPAFIVDVVQNPKVPMDQRRWREQRSVWNQAWFSNQRTANGLLRYARQVGSTDLERRARLMTQVALSAPQKDGLFPAVYTAGGGGYQLYKDTPGWDKGRWTNSDRRPPGTSEDAVHILDASFTARLLLEWHDLNPKETEAVPYVRRYADRLLRLQRPDGSFPGWIEPDGKQIAILTAGPESAMSASLMLDLARRFPKEKAYRESALRALDYLEKGPVAESRWEDFETYFSCSGWGQDHTGEKIARNNLYKSNTFSPFWCAEAFLSAARLTGKKSYLALGRRCLDELSLYQQVWNPPSIPAPTHGGFGVMNADAEWNDARQSLFAPLYLEYYRETGEGEYFERGVSALRASFAMMYCPENAQVKKAYEAQHPIFGPESYGFMMENVYHEGPGGTPIGPFTIFSWGNGAALEASAKVRDRFGEAYVDLKRKQAFGIDGCDARVTDGEVRIEDRFGRPSLTVVSSDGRRRLVKLEGGSARVPLSELGG
jgi:hypothetical protein